MEVECAICLDRNATLKFFPCKHKICCIGCYAHLSDRVCPYCRTKINYVMITGYSMDSFVIEQTIDEIIPSDNESKLFRILKPILTALTSNFVMPKMLAIYNDLNASCADLPKLTLTPSQANALLTIASAKELTLLAHGYMLTKSIVAMCRQPWHVDKNLGGCGLCYNGNFGDVPDLDLGIKILKDNFDRCKHCRFA